MEQEGNIKLSIIIPYYKTKELTNKLLDILTPQITKEVEAVLIDDGCQEDFENIKVIHQENGGVSKARNTGIDNTTGEYIAFIDSDDMVSEKYVQTIIDKINSEPFDYCYISWKFQNGGTVIISEQPPIFNQSCWNCIVSRKAIGEERFKEGMNFAEDQDFNDRVRKGKRANITEVLYYYLANREDSLSRKHARGEQMKIAIYFNNAYEIGGIERGSKNLAEAFTEKGHEVDFIFKDGGNIKFLKQMSEYANVKKIQYADSYDIVIYERHSDTPNIRGNKKGIIVNTNVMDYPDNTILPEMDFYISVSTECAEHFKMKFGKESVVIPNMVAIKDEDDPVDMKKGDINFVTVSRIDINKGFEEMLDMVKLLEENKVDYYWYIVGSGGAEYERKIRNMYQPYPRVIFTGAKENPYPYIKNSDTFVLLSKSESQCMGMIEALAMGKRTITGNFKTAHEYGSNLIIRDSNYTLADIIKKEEGKLIYPDVMKLWEPILKPKPKKNYKFSIIMPNYNNERFIEQSIRSVLNQTYKDWELYIIDDLSTDRSVEFTKMVINNKCKLVINDRKKLNGGSRNVGIELAKKSNPDGYIMCLDSDDWFKDENVLKDINENINDRDVLVLGFEMWNGKKVIYEQMPEYEDHFELFQANHGICCAVWNKVIKTSIMPYFQEGTLMEDRVHHYKTISRARTYGGLDRITHTWNKSNNNSITSNKAQNYNKQIKWDNCAYRHIADMKDLLLELDGQYKEFIEQKISKCINKTNSGIYQQF